MRLPSVLRHSLRLQGLTAVPVRSNLPTTLKMKFVICFLLVCVALAAAAPQFITNFPGFPGYTGLYGGYPNTLVAGPTVVNGPYGRLITPGYVGPTLY